MSEFRFEEGERVAFTTLWSWSFRHLVIPGEDDYDPKSDMDRLSPTLLKFIVEHSSECPLGYLAGLELAKREGRLIDWRYDGFKDSRVEVSLILKEPLKYASFRVEVENQKT